MWPAVVGVANALVASMLAAPPLLVMESATGASEGETQFASAARAWTERGLVAAPLCEVAAVLVGGHPY